jgi:hypothetical protein
MTAHKRSTSKSAAPLPPLPPEADAALQAQVAVVAAACEAGRDLESLQGFVTANPADALWDQHLMAALGNIGQPLIPPLLAALFGGATDKPRRKALRRALHQLRTRGVPVPDGLLPREESLIGRERPLAVKSLVSVVLGNGDSVVVLEAPKEILGGNFLVAVINDETGFRECHRLNMKSRQVEDFWRYYRKQGLSEWYPAPGPYAVRLLEGAYRQGGTAVEAIRLYEGLRDKIWKNWGRPEEAPDLEQALPVLEPAEQGRLLEQSRQLAAQPLFHSWLPGQEELAPWLEKLKEAQRSPLVLSDQQKQVRTDALFEEASRALYPPESRPRWGRRLLAMAYYLDLDQHPAEARSAQAAAADLAEAERNPLAGESPFLKSLVQIGLRLAWEQFQPPQEAQSGSGLLTLPGDAGLIRR